VTIINGGVKVNVVPSEASAFVNYRIHPAQVQLLLVNYRIVNLDWTGYG
jgi:acetylornithine deacetylase/succinyl-diaminopimelate desuccinylase-like protein